LIIPKIEEILENIKENFTLNNNEKDNFEDNEEKNKLMTEGKFIIFIFLQTIIKKWKLMIKGK